MTQASENARDYASLHAEKFKNELVEMLRIPSISTDPAHAADIQRMAHWLAEHLRGLGLQRPGDAHCRTPRGVRRAGWAPVLTAPRCWCTEHYDVVPADLEDGWDAPPFEPVEKDGRLYARRAPPDDKGSSSSTSKPWRPLFPQTGVRR